MAMNQRESLIALLTLSISSTGKKKAGGKELLAPRPRGRKVRIRSRGDLVADGRAGGGRHRSGAARTCVDNAGRVRSEIAGAGGGDAADCLR